MKRKLLPAAAGGALGVLAVPASAMADSLDAANNGVLGDSVALNTLWVVIAAVLVLFMLAGLLSLEAGMSRMKNVGTLVPKALIGMAVAAMAYYAVGFAFAFGNGDIIGSTGFFLRDYGDPQEAFGIMGLSDALIESKWLFQFAFCAVCLAIVWGSTLERIKFHAHAIFALVFAGFIYPLASHWVFGGGWLQSNVGMQDFAGSTAVHLVGATGALAGLLVLGARRGKYGADGKPRPIPGHSMYILGLGMFILLIGWFGFNAGSTLGVADGRFAEVAMVTMLGAAGGILGAYVMTVVLQRTVDIGMVCNGLIAGLVAITAPSGYVENFAAPIIGIVGGLIVVPSIMLIDRKVDDPVGVLSAHGLAGIWGTLACGIFTAPRLAQYNAIGDPGGGFWYSQSFTQLGHQALGVVVVFALVLVLCLITWYAIAKTIGLRVTAEEEAAGLDISEHGMYGYPEQFISDAELYGPAVPAAVKLNGHAPAPAASAEAAPA
ncbi:MAG TPA: ammonium transporter [Solirubrobacteraceae bacterium]|nr:ammonium transporter [Solirubrobacteraceae bacterium]